MKKAIAFTQCCSWQRPLDIFPESVCERFFVKNICRTTSHLHLHIFTSAHLHFHLNLCASSHAHICASTFSHLHICTSTSSLHIYMFTSAHLPHHCASTFSHLHICTSHIFTSRSSFLSLLRPGAVSPEHHEAQPSPEIVRVDGAKCR